MGAVGLEVLDPEAEGVSLALVDWEPEELGANRRGASGEEP